MTPAPIASARPGPRNALTDVAGLRVGSAHDAQVRTGVTVVRPAGQAVCAVDVRGGGPGTRETDALASGTLVDGVHAIVLAGGSVYGLAAAEGVTASLGEAGVGVRLPQAPDAPPAPIVPAAILFDLANGGDKAWGTNPPYRALGARALASAGQEVAQGAVGAGAGARAGSGVGGLGTASLVGRDGITVGALVAVNSFGAVRMPGSDAFWAWPFEIDGEFGGARPWDTPGLAGVAPDDWGAAKANPAGPAAHRTHTTLAVIATDAALTHADAQRLAVMAQDGLARAIRPVHTPFDGDVVFALATGTGPQVDAAGLAILGNRAADTLARAVARGVWAAEQALGEP